MSPLVVLGLLWALTQYHSGAGNLIDQKTGPDALANLKAQGIAMIKAEDDKQKPAFPSELWGAPVKDGSWIFLLWASDDPSSWAVYAIHKAPKLPTEIARGKGAKTTAIASALSKRVQ